MIARKWRPQVFEDLVGQTHISQTLTNALQNERLPHALLFTGPRGTGKTSSARILAKALRCENSKNFTPCGTCNSCLEIALGRSPDVIEIDGASNNGVDSIRDLREGVAFMPSSGKYKVYIIDEVHMLSTSAFNALLKTLEEPPEHVIFILATTEVQKIPQTILSRCQRFDFRRISTRVVVDRMSHICREEKIDFDEDALWTIARQGDGSMRDSLSLLDQVVTFTNGRLENAAIVEILGLTDRSLVLEALQILLSRDKPKALSWLEKFSRTGTEPSLMAQDLLEAIRSVLLIRVAGEGKPQMLEMPDSEYRLFKELAQTIAEEDLHFLFDMALKGAQDISRANDPQIVLEMVFLRMVAAPFIGDLKNLFSGNSERHLGPVHTPATAIAKPVVPTFSAAQSPSEKWFEFVQKAKADDPMFSAKLEQLNFKGEKDKTIFLSIPAKMALFKDQVSDPTFLKKLQSLLDHHWGKGFTAKITAATGAETSEGEGVSASKLAQVKEQKKTDDMLVQVANHPKVKSAASVFKGTIKLNPKS